jgi:hypothetical protein
MRLSFLLLGLVLAGCSAPPGSPAGQSRQSLPAAPRGAVPPDNVPVTKAGEIIGTWYEWAPEGDIQRGDIVLRIDGTQMVANSGCATMAWTYRLTGRGLEIDRAPVSSCARGLTAREERFNQVLDTATQAHHRGGRGLIIEGPNGRIVLHDRPSEIR